VEQPATAEQSTDQPYRVVEVTEKPDPAAIAAAVRAFVKLRLLRRARESQRSNDS
jgi:hypothetical protein